MDLCLPNVDFFVLAELSLSYLSSRTIGVFRHQHCFWVMFLETLMLVKPTHRNMKAEITEEDQTAVGTISVHINIQNRSVNYCFFIIEKKGKSGNECAHLPISDNSSSGSLYPSPFEEAFDVFL
jgi:hypothetical protein